MKATLQFNPVQHSDPVLKLILGKVQESGVWTTYAVIRIFDGLADRGSDKSAV